MDKKDGAQEGNVGQGPSNGNEKEKKVGRVVVQYNDAAAKIAHAMRWGTTAPRRE